MSTRDYAMARVGAAMANIEWAKASLGSAMELFVDSEEDAGGDDRSTFLQDALSSCHGAATAIQSAMECMEEIPPRELEKCEDDIYDDDDDEEGEEE